MKNRTVEYDAQQFAYLLEYDRRRILDCADTFQELAAVLCDRNRETDAMEAETDAMESETDRELLLRRGEARDNRKQYAFTLRQMAGFMQKVACTSVQLIRLGGRREKQMIRAMAQEGIGIQDIYLVRGQEEKLEITVSACVWKKSSVTAEQIADYLSVLMDLRLVSEKRNPYFIGREPVSLYFEEEPVYCCLTAAATAVKENETVSGDSYSFLEGDDSLTAILSDGVGSGPAAAKDSSGIVNLTEQLMEAGLGGRMAVQMLDTMLGVEGNEAHTATLDICRLDLHSGVCTLTKAGAAATFLKRGSEVEKIGGQGLPLGFLREEGEREVTRQLQHGDMVVLVSDGVLQDWACGDGEFWFAQQMERLHVSSPVDMANLLLKYTIEQCRGNIRDDMTILAVGLWENH